VILASLMRGAKAEDDISIEMFSNAYIYQGGPSLH
jgi:hypothetical protein